MSEGFEQQRLAQEAAERSRRAAEEAQRQAREASARAGEQGWRSSQEAAVWALEERSRRGRSAPMRAVGGVFHLMGFIVKSIVFVAGLAVIAAVAYYLIHKYH
jgi:Flp pilus assembly protein TadB